MNNIIITPELDKKNEKFEGIVIASDPILAVKQYYTSSGYNKKVSKVVELKNGTFEIYTNGWLH